MTRTPFQQADLIHTLRTDIVALAAFTHLPPLPRHAQWFAAIVRDCQRTGDDILLIAAIGHLKSTVISLLMLQDLLADVPPHILFGCKSARVLKRTSRFLRRHLKRILGDPTKGELDTVEEFEVPGASREVIDGDINPHWFGATLGLDFEGIRATRAYMDDPIDRSSRHYMSARLDARRWYGDTFVGRLNMGSHITCIGSPWHPEDLYMELAGAFGDREPFEVHVFPHLIGSQPGIYGLCPRASYHGTQGEYTGALGQLWPEEYRTQADIDTLRGRFSGAEVNQRLMCDPRALEDSLCPPESFHFYDGSNDADYVDLDKIYDWLTIWVGEDPAAAEKARPHNSDHSIQVIGWWRHVRTDKLEVFSLEDRTGKWTTAQLEDLYDDIMERYKPSLWLIEESPISTRYTAQLRVKPTKSGHYLPIPPVGDKRLKVGGPKGQRFMSMLSHIENGRIKFSTRQRELVAEAGAFDPDDKNPVMDRWDALEQVCRGLWESAGPRRKPRIGRMRHRR